MTISQDTFVGLQHSTFNNWDNVNYVGPEGSFGGDNNMQAQALFQVTYGGLTPGADMQVWGNLDAAAFLGWAIEITAAGLIRARYGTGVALVSATLDPGTRLLRRWIHATMIVSDIAGVTLFVNGQLVAQTAGDPIAPNTGRAVVGGSSAAFDDPFLGLISGVGFTPGTGIGVDPFASSTTVARTGQIAATVVDSPLQTKPDFCWQVPLYNEDGAEEWAPATGDVPLTRNGVGTLVPGNAPSNMWF